MIIRIGGQAYYLDEKFFAPDWWDNWVNRRQKTDTFPRNSNGREKTS